MKINDLFKVEKLENTTIDIVNNNIKIMEQLFPQVFTESIDENNNLVRKIDFNKLKQELSNELIDNKVESYEFTWVGKKEALLEANKKITKTLRPCIEESKNWDSTKNLYIEGDNLDVLKILQKSYFNKVKMIYIDPPYNTGKDSFTYNDNFTIDDEEYKEEIDYRDEEDNKQFKENKETNPRFHSDWCSMIYSRLKLAKNLLTDDGVIFISIDDREQANLKKICDEVFGERNFISSLFILDNLKGKENDNFIAEVGHKILIYSKNKEKIKEYGFNKTENIFGKKTENKFKYLDDIGFYNEITFQKSGQDKEREKRPYMYFPILLKDNQLYSITKEEFEKIYDKNLKQFNDTYIENLKTFYEKQGFKFILPINSFNEKVRWTSGFETFNKLLKNNDIFYNNGIKQKKRPEMDELLLEYASTTCKSILYKTEYANATNELNLLFNNKKVFDNPKSTYLINDLLKLSTTPDDIILDFFSGSATTAHAVMDLNAEDGGNRQFIMVQLQEECKEDSEAFKAGYKNICEIGKERIRRAGNKIVETTGKNDLDIGFRVFRVDSSNMEDVYYEPNNYTQEMLDGLVSNIKQDRTDEDLLFSCLLENGFPLTIEHKIEVVYNRKIYIIDNLVACFEKNINENVIRYIADLKTEIVFFRDGCFVDSAEKITADEIIKSKMNNCTIKVL